jgi:predicted protein tyrosine phosphatase
MVKYKIEEMSMTNKCKVLDIPDVYNFNDSELIKICKEQYEQL